MFKNVDLTSSSADPDGVKAIHFPDVNPSVVPIVKPRMFPSQAPMKSRVTAVVLVAETIMKSIMSSIYPVVYTIVPARSIIPVSSRPSAIPASVSRVVTIDELGAFAVALVRIAIAAISAFITERGERQDQH